MTSIFHSLILKNKRNLSLILVFVCILYLTLIYLADPKKILSSFAKISVQNWLLILSFSLTNYFLRFIRWHYYLSCFQHKIPLVQHFLYYMSGFALTLTPAKVGETIRSTYLAQHDVPYTHSLAMFFTERFLDVVIIALLSVFIFQQNLIANNVSYQYFIILSLVTIVSFIPLLRQSFVTRFIEYLHSKTHWPALRIFLQHLNKLIQSAQRLFKIKPIYIGLFFGAIAWTIQGVAFYFILTTLDVNISLQQSIGIYAISLLAGALSFIPGGIGTTEAVMTLLLTLLGCEPATAIAAALISRLSTLWFAVLIGLCSATVLSFKESQRS